MIELTGHIGRRTLQSVDRLLELLAFTYRMLGLLFRHPKAGSALVRRVTVEQIYFTAVQALPIIIPTALFIGCLQILQWARLAGQLELGKTVVLLIVREVGPLITAILVILRSATAVTIEISYMNVLHEMDALEMSGLDPLRIVCLPRLIGITCAILSLFAVFDLVAILGGYMVLWATTHIPLGNFLEQIAKALSASDILVGFFKAICFGITITVTCLYRGFQTQHQITGVPMATSKSAIECFLSCLVIDILISMIFL
jgi:phospholipid/cholesterol/gamma-HCH transport system permease protein